MGKLGGRKPKDSAISDGFNTQKIYTKPGRPRKRPAPPADLPTSPTAQLASAIGITASDIDAWGDDIEFDSLTPIPASLFPIEDAKEIDAVVPATVSEQYLTKYACCNSDVCRCGLNHLQVLPTPPKPNPPSAGKADSGADSGEDLFAEGLMDDMRYVYKQLGGRVKLKELMMQDREFINLVKELMKVEAAYLTKKLGMKGEGQTQGFLVVLKGLEGDNKLVKDLVANKTIDFKQIERAMNPTLERSRVEDEIKLGLRPDEIMRKVKEVKD